MNDHNNNNNDYLETLFDSPATNQESDFPLIEVPAHLTQKLYNISETMPAGATNIERRVLRHWPTVTGIAASLLMATIGFQFYQQQQTLQRLEQAQADLATALHYLSEANRISRTQVLESLNDNIKNTVVNPDAETPEGEQQNPYSRHTPNANQPTLKHRTL